MGQYFKIINRSKTEYLEPFSLVATSEKFPSLMYSQSVLQSIGWLTCLSSNPLWLKKKNLTDRTRKFLGHWSGDEIEIIGDYAEEELCREVNDEYKDISIEMMGTLCDLSDEFVDELMEQRLDVILDFSNIAPIALLNNPPGRLVHLLNELFPDGWKKEYYKQMSQ